MSYILDALQKSEQARQRGRVPDLNTLAADARPSPESLPRSPSTATIVALVVASGLAALGWWRPWTTSTPPTAGPTEAAIAAIPSPQTSAAPVTPEDGTRVAIEAPALPAPHQPSPPEAPRASPPAPAPAQTQTPLKKAERLAAHDRVRETSVAPAVSAQVRDRPQTRRILALQELPPAVRAALPRLDVSGYAYAGDSGRRMVVINDRLVHEGDEAAAGVKLLSAAQDGVVFEFQGHRFRGQP